MQISSDFDLTAFGMLETERTALPEPSGFDKLVARSLDEQQAEQEQEREKGGASSGVSFPGQTSREEQQRIENLKNEAMQIASQADGDLTPGQRAQIKAIEQEIADIGGMPMSENLMEKAKGVAESRQAEKADEVEQTEEALNGRSATEGVESGMNGETTGVGMAGVGMLRSQALVTAIKSLSGGSGALGA